METEEKTNDKFKGCMPEMDKQKMAEMMAKCSGDASGTGSWCSMMGECMKGCRWFPLMPLIIGIGLFALGYFLDAEVVRVLWMVLSGIVVLAGILCFIAMNVISRK